MRIKLSRDLGPQAMGLVELAQSAQMLLITPVVSGLPAAVSRMTAKAAPERRVRILRCALMLSILVSLPLCCLAFLLREPLALWLGDIRTLPALLFVLPCIPILGASSALNGYYYGIGRPIPPALSELLEQIIRFFFCVRLCALLRGWPMMLRAAVPSAATMIGETLSMIFMFLLCAHTVFFARSHGNRRVIVSELLTLALPLTGMKLVSSLMHTVSNVLIPARLQLSGLSVSESLAQLGMMHGMMMPILLMPSFVTNSICMVTSPELTRRQANHQPMPPLIRRALFAVSGIGLAAAGAVYLLAPVFSGPLYRQAELLPLLQKSCMLVPILALSQTASSMMNALGLQRKSLYITLFASLVSVLTVYFLAPVFKLWGAVAALFLSELITLCLSLRALQKACMKHSECMY